MSEQNHCIPLPIHQEQLIEQVDEGWRLFWKNRGVILKKQNPNKKWYGYDVLATMLSPEKMIKRALSMKKVSERPVR